MFSPYIQKYAFFNVILARYVTHPSPPPLLRRDVLLPRREHPSHPLFAVEHPVDERVGAGVGAGEEEEEFPDAVVDFVEGVGGTPVPGIKASCLT